MVKDTTAETTAEAEDQRTAPTLGRVRQTAGRCVADHSPNSAFVTLPKGFTQFGFQYFPGPGKGGAWSVKLTLRGIYRRDDAAAVAHDVITLGLRAGV